ncbi:NlpC/P60 family protein [Roseibium litorale]|uniref:C40 family peptidase n=1 Tax=Roseibium litorale TaxID=2803841 RepID=A0ABR9CTL0_9HYPH|nr:NlpC/P60 family protein [Roseibium litorale]MBD8894043.1 C40 family peptidase [Roseibium litorale]
MTEAHSFLKAQAVDIARLWLRTPYHHQASVRGVGCDCLGLLRGIWRDLYGSEPEALPAYSPDWGQVGRVETLLDAAERHMLPVPLAEAGPGDVVVFRMRGGAIAKHCGILSGNGRMVHAQENAGVVEVDYSGAWHRRAVAAFAFP